MLMRLLIKYFCKIVSTKLLETVSCQQLASYAVPLAVHNRGDWLPIGRSFGGFPCGIVARPTADM